MTIPLTPLERYRQLKIGIYYVLAAWFFFAIMYLLGKLCAPHSTVSTMTFFRNLVGFVLSIPWMLWGWKTKFKVVRPGIVLIRGIAGYLNTVFILSAVHTISLVDASLLTNCAPLFVPLIAWVWLKKKVIYALWPPIFIGLVGIILILKPDRDIFNVGALYAIASGIATAVSIITLRMSTHTDKLEAVLFYSYLVGLLLSIPFIFSYWALPSTTILWGLIGIGVFSFLGQWGLFKSLQFGKAAPIASFGYACVIYSGFFDWLIFQHIPDIWTFAGALLVIVGGVWVVILNKPPNTTPYQN